MHVCIHAQTKPKNIPLPLAGLKTFNKNKAVYGELGKGPQSLLLEKNQSNFMENGTNINLGIALKEVSRTRHL